MNAADAIALAKKHLESMGDSNRVAKSSAKLCLDDASWNMQCGEPTFAKNAALRSLRHSVGVLHEDYKRAAK
jgi:hypothetical protein